MRCFNDCKYDSSLVILLEVKSEITKVKKILKAYQFEDYRMFGRTWLLKTKTLLAGMLSIGPILFLTLPTERKFKTVQSVIVIYSDAAIGVWAPSDLGGWGEEWSPSCPGKIYAKSECARFEIEMQTHWSCMKNKSPTSISSLVKSKTY